MLPPADAAAARTWPAASERGGRLGHAHVRCESDDESGSIRALGGRGTLAPRTVGRMSSGPNGLGIVRVTPRIAVRAIVEVVVAFPSSFRTSTRSADDVS